MIEAMAGWRGRRSNCQWSQPTGNCKADTGRRSVEESLHCTPHLIESLAHLSPDGPRIEVRIEVLKALDQPGRGLIISFTRCPAMIGLPGAGLIVHLDPPVYPFQQRSLAAGTEMCQIACRPVRPFCRAESNGRKTREISERLTAPSNGPL